MPIYKCGKCGRKFKTYEAYLTHVLHFCGGGEKEWVNV